MDATKLDTAKAAVETYQANSAQLATFKNQVVDQSKVVSSDAKTAQLAIMNAIQELQGASDGIVDPLAPPVPAPAIGSQLGSGTSSPATVGG